MIPFQSAATGDDGNRAERVGWWHRRRFTGLAAWLLPVIVVTVAQGQWTVTNLHPVGAFSSEVYAVRDGQQVGIVRDAGGAMRASLWTGTAASWASLHPLAATLSLAQGVGNGQQVGNIQLSGFTRASLWSGTAGSRIDLHPDGFLVSYLTDIQNGQQVGGVIGPAITSRASLWTGTAQSRVDLHPLAVIGSHAAGVHNGQQVGTVSIGVFPTQSVHAGFWTGTAQSWVDLHPDGATDSRGFGVYSGQQVGVAVVGGVFHASLWHGTAASWIDLHPAAADGGSSINDVYDGQQVGVAVMGGIERASLWTGTASTWEDLASALTGSWGDTSAQGIWSDGTTTYVVGNGFNLATNRNEALLWTRPTVTQGGDFNDDGLWDCTDINALTTQVAFGNFDPQFDLNGDGVLSLSDVDQWRAIAGSINIGPDREYLPGDANLDALVDGSDFNVWNQNKFTPSTNWCDGNFNADSVVDGSDFNVWNSHKFSASDTGRTLVPEPALLPSGLLILAFAVAGANARSARGRSSRLP